MSAEAEILEEVQGLSGEDLGNLRRLAQKDLYVMCLGVLGYKDMSVEAHGGFCRHIQSSGRRRRLGLMPRAHLKSTIATVGDSIRLACDDPEDSRILIAGETSTLAEKFLQEIRNQWQNNRVLQSLFPELVPEKFSGPGVQWSSTMATLRRSSSHKEPTWQAIGVGGASVGSHFTRIKCDDLIGFEALRSPATMERAKAWLGYLEPLLVNQHIDIIDFIGTRWARNDLYAKVMEIYGEELGVYTRRAIETRTLADGTTEQYIIFPALHTWEEYERIKRNNPSLWYAQYENNPLAVVNSDFPVESVGEFRLNHDGTEVVITSLGASYGKKWKVDELDRVLTADPNSGRAVAEDTAAIIVSGVSPDDEVFVLDAWSGRFSPSAFVDEIYRKARRWRVRVVGTERAGQQNTDHYFKLKAEKEGYRVRVEDLRHGGRAKPERVRSALEPIIRSGQLFLLPSQTTLYRQLAEFPDCVLWDEVDALAYGAQLWRKGIRQEDLERRLDVRKKLLAMRNRITGY